MINRKNLIAPKYVAQSITTDTFTVENGEPIWVYGIAIGTASNTLANNITMKTGDGSETLMVFRSANTFLLTLDIPFIADKGLSFTGDSANSKRITVFYSGPGM